MLFPMPTSALVYTNYGHDVLHGGGCVCVCVFIPISMAICHLAATWQITILGMSLHGQLTLYRRAWDKKCACLCVCVHMWVHACARCTLVYMYMCIWDNFDFSNYFFDAISIALELHSLSTLSSLPYWSLHQGSPIVPYLLYTNMHALCTITLISGLHSSCFLAMSCCPWKSIWQSTLICMS